MNGKFNTMRTVSVYFLVFGLVMFYAATILSMRHAPARPTYTQHQHMEANPACPEPQDAAACVNYHLALLEILSQGIPAVSGALLVVVAALLLLGLGILPPDKMVYSAFIKLRERCRRLYEKTATAFLEQIGFWIALIEKRDPAPAFITVT